MGKYALRRLALLVPTLIGMSLLIFGMLRLLPGDIVDLMTGGDMAADGIREGSVGVHQIDRDQRGRVLSVVEDQGRCRGVIADALPDAAEVVAPAGQLHTPGRRQSSARDTD